MERGRASRGLKVGVYIPRDLAEEVARIMGEAGVDSVSRIVQEGLRLYVAEHAWQSEGDVVGALGVVYDHGVKGVDEELTDAQHAHLGLVVSSLHVHLDARSCLLIIVVRGPSREVKALADRLERIDGAKIVRFMLMPKRT